MLCCAEEESDGRIERKRTAAAEEDKEGFVFWVKLAPRAPTSGMQAADQRNSSSSYVDISYCDSAFADVGDMQKKVLEK